MSDESAVFPSSVEEFQGEAQGDFLEDRAAKRELLEELRQSWQDGRPVEPEDLIDRWPSNPETDPDVASLLFEDFLQRQTHDKDASVAAYEDRFPNQKNSLAGLFRQHGVLHSVGAASLPSSGTLSLPTVGDQLFNFRLRGELGRGAFARVFLAEEADLAGRAVVLKVSSIDGQEPQMLAQLQHTHIVPIYSVHEDPNGGVRAVCMPYFGGASLSAVLRACWIENEMPRKGAELVHALRQIQSPWPAFPAAEGAPPPPADAPALQTLSRLDYVQASVWLVARLAEALHHAHQRGVLHRDIKPSNVLLGAEGEPMLLDFNLAQRFTNGQEQAHATLGGTIAYMAPEHLRALAARNLALTAQINQRADIYSLGMVLYEMLTGRTPFDQSGSYSFLPPQLEAMALERAKEVPSLRRHRNDVPWSLESIARKCMMPEPADRYESAEQLAQDLQAFLNDEPLRHAPELSRAERCQKWLRRHPRVVSTGSVALLAFVLLGGAGAALVGLRAHLGLTQAQLAQAESRDRKLEFETGTQKALCLVNTTTDVKDHLPKGQAACEQTLGLYEILTRADWQQSEAWQLLTADERRAMGEDARELLLLLAWARTRVEADVPATYRDALTLLDKAEAIDGLGESRALWEDRASYLGRLGDTDQAAAAQRKAHAIPATTARDHYSLANTWVRQAPAGGQGLAQTRAAEELTRAIQLNPRHYWSRMQRGICYQELGDFALAAADFGACVGLWPEFAWGHFNEGYVLDQSGKKKEAVASYTAALERDPTFALAYLNRGLANLELKKYDAALDDFRLARTYGHDQPFLHAGRGVALEALGRGAEADEAFRIALARGPGLGDAAGQRLRWVYGFAVARRLPAEAEAAFREVLTADPAQPQALYGRALLAVERDANSDEALQLFGRALDGQPGFIEARRARAILLARTGQFEAAGLDINLCLEKEPRGGATLYAAACVAARVAEKRPGAQDAADQALKFLRQAFAVGYGADKAARDPDLTALRGHPGFRELLAVRSRDGGPVD